MNELVFVNGCQFFDKCVVIVTIYGLQGKSANYRFSVGVLNCFLSLKKYVKNLPDLLLFHKMTKKLTSSFIFYFILFYFLILIYIFIWHSGKGGI